MKIDPWHTVPFRERYRSHLDYLCVLTGINKMSRRYTNVLLITANVGSIFEDVSEPSTFVCACVCLPLTGVPSLHCTLAVKPTLRSLTPLVLLYPLVTQILGLMHRLLRLQCYLVCVHSLVLSLICHCWAHSCIHTPVSCFYWVSRHCHSVSSNTVHLTKWIRSRSIIQSYNGISSWCRIRINKWLIMSIAK